MKAEDFLKSKNISKPTYEGVRLVDSKMQAYRIVDLLNEYAKIVQSEANGDEQSSSNCNIPLVSNRTCSNCHYCVVNPSSENEHDQYKCFAREHITTISNINNYVCDKWTETSF